MSCDKKENIDAGGAHNQYEIPKSHVEVYNEADVFVRYKLT